MVIAVDTNVIIDVLQDDKRWADWSIGRIGEARKRGEVAVSAAVVAELSRDFEDVDALRSTLADLDLTIELLDDATAFLAGKRFNVARATRTAGAPARPLADFFIGAHALSVGATLLTRDPTIYRRYFPDLPLITPETDNG